MKHPLIIGAGGVASYMLPVLLKTFHPENLTIVDKDTLEERNLDRQMFRKEDIGKNKAKALVEIIDFNNTYGSNPTVIEKWFDEETGLPEGVDAIFCCADNHKARYAARLAAERLGVFAYIGGNEYVDSQAIVYHRDWIGTDRDFLKKYPTIATDETGSPTRCTGEVQEASPQLAMANFHCAAKLLHLAWIYERYLPNTNLSPSEIKGLISNFPIEFYSSLYGNESNTSY